MLYLYGFCKTPIPFYRFVSTKCNKRIPFYYGFFDGVFIPSRMLFSIQDLRFLTLPCFGYLVPHLIHIMRSLVYRLPDLNWVWFKDIFLREVLKIYRNKPIHIILSPVSAHVRIHFSVNSFEVFGPVFRHKIHRFKSTEAAFVEQRR